MTLSEFILDNTNDGRDIVRVLVDVMNGYIRGVKPNHRLTAARLLTIYGYQDARDFMDENVSDSSDEKQREGKWVIIDPKLAKLIRTKTNDGQEICLFLIDIMAGESRRHPRRTPRVSGQRAPEPSVRQEPELASAHSSTCDRAQGNDPKDRAASRVCVRSS